jgi:hypothetical protein
MRRFRSWIGLISGFHFEKWYSRSRAGLDAGWTEVRAPADFQRTPSFMDDPKPDSVLKAKPSVAAISLPKTSVSGTAIRPKPNRVLRLLPGSFRLSPAARRHAPCSVLHRRRFFVPRPSRTGRWAFTPPFHPYPKTHEAPPGGLFSVTLSVAPGLRRKRPRLLRGLLPGGVRTFLSRANRERPPAVQNGT